MGLGTQVAGIAARFKVNPKNLSDLVHELKLGVEGNGDLTFGDDGYVLSEGLRKPNEWVNAS